MLLRPSSMLWRAKRVKFGSRFSQSINFWPAFSSFKNLELVRLLSLHNFFHALLHRCQRTCSSAPPFDLPQMVGLNLRGVRPRTLQFISWRRQSKAAPRVIPHPRPMQPGAADLGSIVLIRSLCQCNFFPALKTGGRHDQTRRRCCRYNRLHTSSRRGC